MAKNIKFNVILNVDGKEHLVTATTDAKNLRNAVDSVGGSVQGVLKRFNNFGFAFQNISSAAQNIASSLDSITAESRSFSGAMAAANTMAGKIQDKIQLTAKNGVTSFEQLAQALPRVAANASTLGVTVDEEEKDGYSYIPVEIDRQIDYGHIKSQLIEAGFAQKDEFGLLMNAMNGDTVFGSMRYVDDGAGFAFWLGGETGDDAPTSITRDSIRVEVPVERSQSAWELWKGRALSVLLFAAIVAAGALLFRYAWRKV